LLNSTDLRRNEAPWYLLYFLCSVSEPKEEVEDIVDVDVDVDPDLDNGYEAIGYGIWVSILIISSYENTGSCSIEELNIGREGFVCQPY